MVLKNFVAHAHRLRRCDPFIWEKRIQNVSNLIEHNLRYVVEEVFEDAVAYFEMRAVHCDDPKTRIFMGARMKEYAAGLYAMDLLIDRKTGAVLTQEGAEDLLQSLENYLRGIDRKLFPMLAWRACNALERIYSLANTSDGGGDGQQASETSDVTYH